MTSTWPTTSGETMILSQKRDGSTLSSTISQIEAMRSQRKRNKLGD